MDINEVSSKNPLLLYWNGVNVYPKSAGSSSFSFKSYFQFQEPLFLTGTIPQEDQSKINSFLLDWVGNKEKIYMNGLICHPDFVFTTVSKKPSADFENRLCYTIRVGYAKGGTDLPLAAGHFLVNELNASQACVDSVFKAAQALFDTGDYQTFPLGSFGFYRVEQNGPFRSQIALTCNTNTLDGIYRPIGVETAKQRTAIVLDSINKTESKQAVFSLIEFFYAQHMALAFYGFDVSPTGLEKIKLYFRALGNLSYIDFRQESCNHLGTDYGNSFPTWEKTSAFLRSCGVETGAQKKPCVEIIAASFTKTEEKLHIPSCFQFYFSPNSL